MAALGKKVFKEHYRHKDVFCITPFPVQISQAPKTKFFFIDCYVPYFQHRLIAVPKTVTKCILLLFVQGHERKLIIFVWLCLCVFKYMGTKTSGTQYDGT